MLMRHGGRAPRRRALRDRVGAGAGTRRAASELETVMASRHRRTIAPREPHGSRGALRREGRAGERGRSPRSPARPASPGRAASPAPGGARPAARRRGPLRLAAARLLRPAGPLRPPGRVALAGPARRTRRCARRSTTCAPATTSPGRRASSTSSCRRDLQAFVVKGLPAADRPTRRIRPRRRRCGGRQGAGAFAARPPGRSLAHHPRMTPPGPPAGAARPRLRAAAARSRPAPVATRRRALPVGCAGGRRRPALRRRRPAVSDPVLGDLPGARGGRGGPRERRRRDALRGARRRRRAPAAFPRRGHPLRARAGAADLAALLPGAAGATAARRSRRGIGGVRPPARR